METLHFFDTWIQIGHTQAEEEKKNNFYDI